MYIQNDNAWLKQLLADKEPPPSHQLPINKFCVGDRVRNVYGDWKGEVSSVSQYGEFSVKVIENSKIQYKPRWKRGEIVGPYRPSQDNFFEHIVGKKKRATRPSRILNNDIFTAIVSRMPPTKDEKVFLRAKPRRPLRPFREAEPTDLVEFPEMPGKHWMVIGKAGWGEIQAICLETKIVDGISIWKEDRLGGADRMADITKAEFAFEEVE